MTQPPSALSLILCDQVIFEHETRKPTVVGIFTTITCPHFPSPPKTVDVFAMVTDGIGCVNLEMVILSSGGRDALR